MKSIKELTKAEEQLMKVVWQLGRGTIKEFTEGMPHPKPVYNTVATVLKVLKSKNFVDSVTNANTFIYYPIIAEKEYRKFAFDKVFDGYFSSSYHNLVSFLVEEKDLDADTQKRLQQLIEKFKD